jgi:hypothetical protein
MNKLGTKIILIILLTLVVASQFATSAGSYQQCKTEYASQKGEKESQKNYAWVALGAVNRWAVCTGRVIDANRESISAAGTLVIALFTVILGAGMARLFHRLI